MQVNKLIAAVGSTQKKNVAFTCGTIFITTADTNKIKN
jgi:hypothetical protein